MPTERGILHSNIHPGDAYSRNLLDHGKLKKWILSFLEIGEVPRVIQILFWTFWEISLIHHAKPIPEFTSIQVRSILNFDLIAHLILDVIPVILFNVLVNGLVIAPVNMVIFFFPSLCDLLKLLESVPDQVLIKWHTLG